jgi:hypothetical protein
VIEWEPRVSAAVAHCAWAAASVTALQSVVDPSLKVTVPVGVPLATVAVNVTDCPEIDGFTLDASVVVVAVGSNVNVALTAVAAFMVTLQLPVPEHPPPDQPEKEEPAAGEGLSVTVVPSTNEALHVVPQLIPAGDEVTVPLPVLLTVKGNEGDCTVCVSVFDVLPA